MALTEIRPKMLTYFTVETRRHACGNGQHCYVTATISRTNVGKYGTHSITERCTCSPVVTSRDAGKYEETYHRQGQEWIEQHYGGAFVQLVVSLIR